MVSKLSSNLKSLGSNPSTPTMLELKDNPGIIILPDKVVRTTKIKKWFDKNKPTEYSITYLEPIPTDFRDVERGLKELENKYLGLGPIKEKEIRNNSEYKYTLRINQNTVLCAYTLEQFNLLKKWYGRED